MLSCAEGGNDLGGMSDKLARGQFCFLGSDSPLGSGRDPGRRP